MSIRQLHTHRELEVQYQTLLNKYTIMTNLYGENGSDDPNVIKDITQCYDQRKTLQNELRVKEERIRYLDSLVDVLQRQLINRCPTTGE